MSRKQGTVKLSKALSFLAIVLMLAAFCGFVAYYTSGFTSDFKTFYVECDGEQILDTREGFKMSKDEPMLVDVKYTFGAINKEMSGYSVKVVPNVIRDKDINFTLDGNAYSFQAEDDFTNGFEIVQEEHSFTIKPKGGLNDIMKAVYPNYEISDCSDKAYENMFTLVVTSYNKKASVNLNFTIVQVTEGVILDKEVIKF